MGIDRFRTHLIHEANGFRRVPLSERRSHVAVLPCVHAPVSMGQITQALTDNHCHCSLEREIGTCWHEMTELYVLELKSGKK